MTTQMLSALLSVDPATAMERDRRSYEAQLCAAAGQIAANASERPVVLLAGPSGSGKTTTALLIERELRKRGLPAHTLQMDDYFSTLTPQELELFRENRLDLERPDRVDIPFFQEQLGMLLAGQEVELPHYDFKASRRLPSGRKLRRQPGELVIMEGIHALNPEVTGYTDQTTRIYVSVRTRVTTQSGAELHPSMIRLARRLLRDRMGRGRKLTETLGMKARVDAGEKNYILPFKPMAHCSIDTFHACELSLYRPWLLSELSRLLPEEPWLRPLVEALSQVPELSGDALPGDSLLREFLGGSSLVG